jgi:hypothetical protein
VEDRDPERQVYRGSGSRKKDPKDHDVEDKGPGRQVSRGSGSRRKNPKDQDQKIRVQKIRI